MNNDDAHARSKTPVHLANQSRYLTAGHPWRVALETFHPPSGPRTLFVRYYKKAAKKGSANDVDNGRDKQTMVFCIEEGQGENRVQLTSPVCGQNGGFTASAIKLGLLEPVGHTKVSVSGYYRPPDGATLPAVRPPCSRGSRKRSGILLGTAPLAVSNDPASATASQTATRTAGAIASMSAVPTAAAHTGSVKTADLGNLIAEPNVVLAAVHGGGDMSTLNTEADAPAGGKDDEDDQLCHLTYGLGQATGVQMERSLLHAHDDWQQQTVSSLDSAGLLGGSPDPGIAAAEDQTRTVVDQQHDAMAGILPQTEAYADGMLPPPPQPAAAAATAAATAAAAAAAAAPGVHVPRKRSHSRPQTTADGSKKSKLGHDSTKLSALPLSALPGAADMTEGGQVQGPPAAAAAAASHRHTIVAQASAPMSATLPGSKKQHPGAHISMGAAADAHMAASPVAATARGTFAAAHGSTTTTTTTTTTITTTETHAGDKQDRYGMVTETVTKTTTETITITRQAAPQQQEGQQQQEKPGEEGRPDFA